MTETKDESINKLRSIDYNKLIASQYNKLQQSYSRFSAVPFLDLIERCEVLLEDSYHLFDTLSVSEDQTLIEKNYLKGLDQYINSYLLFSCFIININCSKYGSFDDFQVKGKRDYDLYSYLYSVYEQNHGLKNLRVLILNYLTNHKLVSIDLFELNHKFASVSSNSPSLDKSLSDLASSENTKESHLHISDHSTNQTDHEPNFYNSEVSYKSKSNQSRHLEPSPPDQQLQVPIPRQLPPQVLSEAPKSFPKSNKILNFARLELSRPASIISNGSAGFSTDDELWKNPIDFQSGEHLKFYHQSSDEFFSREGTESSEENAIEDRESPKPVSRDDTVVQNIEELEDGMTGMTITSPIPQAGDVKTTPYPMEETDYSATPSPPILQRAREPLPTSVESVKDLPRPKFIESSILKTYILYKPKHLLLLSLQPIESYSQNHIQHIHSNYLNPYYILKFSSISSFNELISQLQEYDMIIVYGEAMFGAIEDKFWSWLIELNQEIKNIIYKVGFLKGGFREWAKSQNDDLQLLKSIDPDYQKKKDKKPSERTSSFTERRKSLPPSAKPPTLPTQRPPIPNTSYLQQENETRSKPPNTTHETGSRSMLPSTSSEVFIRQQQQLEHYKRKKESEENQRFQQMNHSNSSAMSSINSTHFQPPSHPLPPAQGHPGPYPPQSSYSQSFPMQQYHQQNPQASSQSIPQPYYQQYNQPYPQASGYGQPLQSYTPQPLQGQNLHPHTHQQINSLTVMEKLSICGLRNFGSTCYVNSTVQALSAISSLKTIFITNKYRDYIKVNEVYLLSGALSSLLRSINNHGGCSIAPTKFLKTCAAIRPDLKIPYEQQDSQEFLLFVLDRLHDELKLTHNVLRDYPALMEYAKDGDEEYIKWYDGVTKDGLSPISALFQGQIENKLTCNNCHYVSSNYSIFSMLSLSIPHGKKAHLNDCIAEFTSDELLSGDNAWDCPKCGKASKSHPQEVPIAEEKKKSGGLFRRSKKKKPVDSKASIGSSDSIKSLSFLKLPPILIIHLSRFSPFDITKKLSAAVTYPLLLHIAGKRYKLVGLINHFGNLKSGHYTSLVNKAYRENLNDPYWCYFDDEDVRQNLQHGNVGDAQHRNLSSKDVYVLFYERI